MKRLIITGFALATAASALAQGTVQFNNRGSGNISYVYYNAAVKTQIQGNGTAESVAGTVDWTGFTRLSGSGYMAAMLGGPNAGSLLVASPTTTFRTGTAAGNFALTTATLGNVAADAASAVVQVFAWDNTSGQYSTYASAFAAWQAGTIAGGMSAIATAAPVGGVNNQPPIVPFASFNIYTIPEPTTVALAGLAGAGLLIFRRRK